MTVVFDMDGTMLNSLGVLLDTEHDVMATTRTSNAGLIASFRNTKRTLARREPHQRLPSKWRSKSSLCWNDAGTWDS